MLKSIFFAGALLAVTGVTPGAASASAYHGNRALRAPIAYRTSPMRVRGLRASGVRRLSYRVVRTTPPLTPRTFGHTRAFRLSRPGTPFLAARIASRRLVRPAAYRLVQRNVMRSGNLPSRKAYAPHPVAVAGAQVGGASFYTGGRTASGGLVGAATCAHRFLPFGTRVLVTNLSNARTAMLTVNDRGPFVGGRIVDVSRTAAGILGMLGSGVAHVRLQVVGRQG